MADPSGQVLSRESLHQVSFNSLYSFIQPQTLVTFKKCLFLIKNDPDSQTVAEFSGWGGHEPENPLPDCKFIKSMRGQVNLNTRRASLNCGSACFCLQWFSAPILHTTIVIYGNYPSLGSSINWLLLGNGSSCCLVGGSSTVRGNAGEFKRRHRWRRDEIVLFCYSFPIQTEPFFYFPRTPFDWETTLLARLIF